MHRDTDKMLSLGEEEEQATQGDQPLLEEQRNRKRTWNCTFRYEDGEPRRLALISPGRSLLHRASALLLDASRQSTRVLPEELARIVEHHLLSLVKSPSLRVHRRPI
jgi:hypothetical protein